MKSSTPDSAEAVKTKRKHMTAARAAQIVNDIHEQCCRASRAELMECASHLSLRNCILYQEVASAHMEHITLGFQKIKEFRERAKATS